MRLAIDEQVDSSTCGEGLNPFLDVLESRQVMTKHEAEEEPLSAYSQTTTGVSSRGQASRVRVSRRPTLPLQVQA